MTIATSAIEDAPANPRTIAAGADDPRSLVRGLNLFAVHVALYLATLIFAIADFDLPVNILFGAANGVFIALLFIIGHDANHMCFVPDRWWNRWLGRLAFIPCVHSASLWRRTHNDMHHQRTNLKGVDCVWTPMSKAEYDAASPARRWLERVYRGPFGPLIYYYGTFWLYRLVLPLAPETRRQWKRHLPDSIFVVSGFAFTIAAIGLAGHWLAPHRPLWLVYLTGWVLPFAVWNYVMALTIYLNHTHPTIPWFSDERMWSFHRGNVLGTVHIKLPRWLAPLYSDALAHTAHHADVSLPVYELPAAQAKLKETFGADLQEYSLSFAEYQKIYTACKLFDFARMCWTDFDGMPTAMTWAATPHGSQPTGTTFPAD
jgi:omega-6 fatty acid desaturase (delta-12 desaturase)